MKNGQMMKRIQRKTAADTARARIFSQFSENAYEGSGSVSSNHTKMKIISCKTQNILDILQIMVYNADKRGGEAP